MSQSSQADTYLDSALEALAAGERWRPALDALPVPLYTTDTDGNVTFWNRACIDFAGREPQLGADRWCVTWRLFTTEDEPLPHDQCPMAVAIRERRAVRGAVAIAMRPDGSRKAFTPYPTPLFDADGAMTGAVNMLVDISAEHGLELARQASRCRRLADAVSDRQAADILRAMAENYDTSAAGLSG